MAWKALLVPRWSKSWHMQPTIKARISASDSTSWNAAVCTTHCKAIDNRSIMETPPQLTLVSLANVNHFAFVEGCDIFMYFVYVTLGTYCDHDKHALGHVKGMSPVMICYSAIVLSHSQKPATQYLRGHGNRENNPCEIYLYYHV